MLNLFSSNKTENEDITLDFEKIPKHIAIIMDGNGRWAQARKLPRVMGHKAGVETVRTVVKKCNSLGVKYLTLYMFSTENWKRPKDEINSLMKLLAQYLKSEFDELNSNNVVINHIGDISKLPEICQKELIDAYEKTKNNTGLVLTLAINYGGRDEIIYAVKRLYKDISEKGMNIDDIDKDLFNNYLYTAEMPDPDIIIRPSGEQRLSNFLLWQCAYSEFWYSDINWPDFTEKDLEMAIYDYQHRDRRFGGIKK
ncbi:isoprenyl transferase [Inconstantimicrobium porci]|uniref:Isoprenyl transferase n=1 Tax=Inconstantimicrobium porci TaxID=2652291 RepID=A0A7X2T036_9CLOT|nr:isoprenyl transferase [Inconstantimicrobium porci]MDD6772092.1 isoprenyl transferase [Inconstantimicrobium porci]MSR90152.1 isoprenyl transferase [Inconstantimicrobium porci]